MGSTGAQRAESYAEAMVKGAHSSFYWAMRLLPSEKRNAMYSIYAFCRIVDDIADNPGQPEDKRRRLQLWRDEITHIGNSQTNEPVVQAIGFARQRFGLQECDFLAVIDGMEMDVGEGNGAGKVRIADLSDLNLYCDRVAGAVGRLSNQVFGLEPAVGNKLAQSLGRALQLTNILRDLKEDSARNRIYLPLDLLKRHGIDDDDPARVLASPKLPAVCAEIAAMAEKDFSDSDALMAGLDRTQIRPIVIMKDIYRPILHRLIQGGWKDLDKSVRLSKLHRLWIVFRSGILGL